MNFQIPEGANVQIIIGGVVPLALTDQSKQPHEETTRKSGRRALFTIFKFTGAVAVVIGCFWLGEQRGQAAGEDAGFAAPPAVQQAFPVAPAAGEAGPATGQAPQLPLSFQAQLQQPPSIQLAPGQTPAATNTAGSQNAFGLSD